MALKAFYITAMVITLVMLGTSLFSRRSELTKRCITLVVLINLVCLILLLGRISFTIFMLAVAAAGAFELALCVQMNNFEKSLMVISGTVLFVLFKLYFSSFYYVLNLGIIMSFLLLWSKFSFNNKRYIAWGSLICIVIPCTVLLTNVDDAGMVHIIAVILLVQFNDGFAYLGGKKWGKTGLGIINSISPNKTREGYMAGMFGILLAVLLLHTIIPVYPDNGELSMILYWFVW